MGSKEAGQTPAEQVKNRGSGTKGARTKKPSLLRDIGAIMLWCACVFAAMLIAESVAAAIASALPGSGTGITTKTLALLYVIYDVSLVGLVVFLPRWFRAWRVARRQSATSSPKKKTQKAFDLPTIRDELGLTGLPTWTDIGLAPVGYAASLFIAAGITKVFRNFSWFDVTEAQDVGFSSMMAASDRVVAFLAVAVVAPIAEEIIFRGWLYGRVRARLGQRLPELWTAVISAIIVSLLFAVAHGQWNVGVTVFALSMVLCGLREITGTIYSGILVHFLKNAIAFVLLFVLDVGW